MRPMQPHEGRTVKHFIRSLLVFGALSVAATSVSAAEGYKVIVHPDNPTTTLSKRQLAKLMLKRDDKWEDGVAIEPVDQTYSSPARIAFSTDVIGKSVDAVKSHWHQQIFSGRGQPPPMQPNDAAVVAFVLAKRGAVGYVSANAETGGAKVVRVVP